MIWGEREEHRAGSLTVRGLWRGTEWLALDVCAHFEISVELCASQRFAISRKPRADLDHLYLWCSDA